MSEEIVLYAILAAIGFGVWVTDWSPLSSEVTAYPISCEQRNKQTTCKYLEKVHYKVFEDTQKVVLWLDGGFPTSLGDCAVRNKNDWVCFSSRTTGTSVIDGQFFTYPKEDHTSYVPKWRWWGIKLGLITS